MDDYTLFSTHQDTRDGRRLHERREAETHGAVWMGILVCGLGILAGMALLLNALFGEGAIR